LADHVLPPSHQRWKKQWWFYFHRKLWHWSSLEQKRERTPKSDSLLQNDMPLVVTLQSQEQHSTHSTPQSHQGTLWDVHPTGTCCFSRSRGCRAPGLKSMVALTAHMRSSDKEGLPLMCSSWRDQEAVETRSCLEITSLPSSGLTTGLR